MAVCEHKVMHQLTFGRLIERCGKPSIVKDIHNRSLCQKHYNKWLKKTKAHPNGNTDVPHIFN